MDKKLRLFPLGGAGEVGKNLFVIEYGKDAIAFDCGLMFPESDMLGINLVLPDVSYLIEHPGLLKGIFFTHGHEDHIGALPYIIPNLSVPVYATPLTRALIESKLRRNSIKDKVTFNTISVGNAITIGPFRIEPFHLGHSIPGAVGFVIHTPFGIIIYTGEYTLDFSPIDGVFPEIEKLRGYGDNGVLALITDSTNVEVPGHTPSENSLDENFNKIFATSKDRIIVAIFASNISRIQHIVNVAKSHGRKVAFSGQSMVNNIKIARSLGYLDIQDEMMIQPNNLDQYPDSKITIVCTGTQGEPNSVMMRLAHSRHSEIAIKPTDTVVLSSSVIPGNEDSVYSMIDDIFRLTYNVIYQKIMQVHVSGHASREDQKMMLEIIRPKYFIPTGGDFRMLVLHCSLAKQVGIPLGNSFVAENGQVIEIDDNKAVLAERIPGGYVVVDGSVVGDLGNDMIADRYLLSRDGFVAISIVVDKFTNALKTEPIIISKGFAYEHDQLIIEKAKRWVIDFFDNPPPQAIMKK
jgi:ribonuclease J